jgi:DNA helicase-2/ATP-dependent DNA helicase PcrA
MFRIFGPPGTGKTTTLLNMVDTAIQGGTEPSNIAFLAFTRKAAYEAKERAARRFDLNPDKDLPYFRTLHSLAYMMLGIKENQLMQREHFDELSNKIGIVLTIRSAALDDDDVGLITSDHPIIGLINLSRLKKTSLRTEYNCSSLEEDWMTVDYVNRAYHDYKNAHGLIDYTDMLVEFVDNAINYCPEFDLCFMDEAQDLSPLQWDIAHALDKRAKSMYAAGDDDQAIYKWAGADVDHFIGLPSGSEVLEQSYRIPAEVHKVAESISTRIQNRFPKKYLPRKETGKVQRIYSVSEVDMSEGDWLVLAQANYMLSSVATQLKYDGYLFERNGHRSISEKISTAVNGWERLRKGHQIDCDTAQAIYDYMTGNGVRIARGFKRFSVHDKDKVFDLPTLQLQYGLGANDTMIWHEAMDKLPMVDQIYITSLLRRKEKFNAVPRIKLSTIHGAKGGEADNVVLFTDLTTAALKERGDDIHRVFYVGVTRTRQNLYIVEPEDVTRSYII